MRLFDYVNIIRRRWWLIALVAFVAAVAAYGFSKMQTPIFRAQATYIVVPSRYDYGLTLQLPGTMNSWTKLILSDQPLRQLSEELGLDRTPGQLQQDIHIQPRPDEMVVLIEADAPDPAQAVAIANTVGRKLQAEIANLNLLKEGTDKINITVTEEAHDPFLHKPKTKINVLAAGMLGLILGILLAFVAEYLDDTFKSAEDVERYLGLTTLGQIPMIEDSARNRGRVRRLLGSRRLGTETQ